MKRIEFIVRLQTRIADEFNIKLSRDNISLLLDTILDEIVQTALSGIPVKLRDFGVFSVKPTEERESWSIKQKERVVLPASQRFKFKPFKSVKERVRNAKV